MTPIESRELERGDFHVHSTFSEDATSSLAENIAAAAAIGLTELRLIDHVRASTMWVPEFIAAVRAEHVPAGLRVFTGVEAKIMNSRGELDVPKDLRVGAGGIDAIVIADHQFPGVDGPWTPTETRARLDAGLAASDAIDLLIAGLIGAMRATSAGQLAHCFSILPKVGLTEGDIAADQLSAWAAAAAETGTSVEVNEKWGCPGPQSIRACLDAGVTVVASTDAHVASAVGVYERVTVILDDVSLL